MRSSFSQEVQNFPQCNVTAPQRVRISGWLAATPVLERKKDREIERGWSERGRKEEKRGSSKAQQALGDWQQHPVPTVPNWRSIQRRVYNRKNLLNSLHAHTVYPSQCHRQMILSTRSGTTQTITVSTQVPRILFFSHLSNMLCTQTSPIYAYAQKYIPAPKSAHCLELYSTFPAAGGTRWWWDRVVRNTFRVGTAHQRNEGREKRVGINFLKSHITTWEGMGNS